MVKFRKMYFVMVLAQNMPKLQLIYVMFLRYEHRLLYNAYLQMQRSQMKMNRFHASLISISSKYIAFLRYRYIYVILLIY